MTDKETTMKKNKQWIDIKPKFGDILENSWASENNPHRVGVYIKTNNHTGRCNPGKHFYLTDMNGSFWELKHDKESKTKIMKGE